MKLYFQFFLAVILFGTPMFSGAQNDRLGKPDQVWIMPPELKEISALTFAPGETYLLCVQDERGIVYGLDPVSGQLTQTWTVTGKGDYEGLEMVDSTLYLLRSDGILYRTKWHDGPDSLVEKMDAHLPAGTDVEGLGYDPQTGSLLLCIKDFENNATQSAPLVKGWVHWDLNNDRPDTQVCGITQEALRNGILEDSDKKVKGRLMEWLDQKDGQFPLGPSGLASHPTTHDIWMLSARGKLLLVFDSAGAFKRLYALNPSILPQPEGIAFNRKGDLFIASEGKKGIPASVVVYRNRK
ncbi:MAG: hypothetical protein K9I85_14400 [Saprospiraceae bacterium]|nr:hypothetical protein [Saprospiraceae bacterium]